MRKAQKVRKRMNSAAKRRRKVLRVRMVRTLMRFRATIPNSEIIQKGSAIILRIKYLGSPEV